MNHFAPAAMRSRPAFLLLTSCLAGLGASPACAQPDSVVVTATRRPAQIEDIPASVSVISGVRAEQANALGGAEDVTRYFSGLEAAVANGAQVAFQIRGIGAVDHQALTPTAAAVYADGVFLATNVQTSLLLYDVERVELLKGPQGTLYGRNASSGAVNFITARPSADQRSYVGLSYGRFDRFDMNGAIGGALTDRLSVRVAGRYLSEDPALDNVQSDPSIPAGPKRAGGVRDEWGLRTSLLYEFDNDASILLRGHYEEDNGVNPTPRNSSLTLGKHEISTEGDGVQDTDNAFFGAAIEAQAARGLWSFYSLTAFEGYEQRYGFDFDGTPGVGGNPALNANLSYDRDFSQWSQEARATASFDGWDVLVGVTAAAEDFSQDYLIWCGALDPASLIGTCSYVGAPGRVGPAPASPGTAMTLLTHIAQERKTAAIFTYHDLALTDRLTLTLGGRFTYERIEGDGFGVHVFDDGVVAYNNRDGAGAAIGSNRIEENRFTGNAALRYALGDNASVYVSFASGYKSGGFNGEVQNNATHFQDEGLFAAETVNAYEAGFKARAGDDFAFNAAAFYQDYNDPQARIFVNFPLPGGGAITSNSLANLDNAVSYGAEADMRWTPARGLDLSASVTWLETEIRQTSDIGGNAAAFDGNPLPFAPEFSSSLWARYEWPLAPQVRAALSAGAKIRSSFYLDAEGLASRRQDGYALADAEASLYFDAAGLQISLWGRNLNNADVAVSGYGFIGYNTFRSAPRSYGVAAKVVF